MTKQLPNSKLLDTFWDLAKSKDEARVTAASVMVKALAEKQVEVKILNYFIYHGR